LSARTTGSTLRRRAKGIPPMLFELPPYALDLQSTAEAC
jgi:hypothetical protein